MSAYGQHLKCIKNKLNHFIMNQMLIAFSFSLDLPCELNVPGLQSKYRFEKCTKTRSRSCVSPDKENCFKNCLRASSNFEFEKSKCFKYSSATARLKSLLIFVK